MDSPTRSCVDDSWSPWKLKPAQGHNYVPKPIGWEREIIRKTVAITAEYINMLEENNVKPFSPLIQHRLPSTIARNEGSRLMQIPNRQPPPAKIPAQPGCRPCGFCKRNGEVDYVANSHSLRVDGKITCPILRKFVCPNCRATGDFAHTESYCPKINSGNKTNNKCLSTNGRLALAVALKGSKYNSSGALRRRF